MSVFERCEVSEDGRGVYFPDAGEGSYYQEEA
jgi:hypothetical protein